MSHSISLALAALRVGVGSPKASPRGRYRVGTMRRQASLYLELLAGSCNYLSPGRRGLPMPLDTADCSEDSGPRFCSLLPL